MPQNRNNRGQALVLLTMSTLILFGMLGLTVDMGWAYYRRQVLYQAAEAAAVAAASRVAGGSISCGQNGVACQSATACPTSIATPVSNNIQAGCLYAYENDMTPGNPSQTVTMEAGTGAVPAAPGVNVTYWVRAEVTEVLPQTFSRIFDHASATVRAAAVAGISGSSADTCIYVLAASGNEAFLIQNNAQVTIDCRIAINSNASQALVAKNNARLTTTGVSVRGNYSILNHAQVTPPPTANGPAVADPKGSVPAPSVGSCNHTDFSRGDGNHTLTPGVYCGGITLQNNGVSTFSPGTYIIKGGSFTIQNNHRASGAGVFFYLTNGSSSFGGLTFQNNSETTFSAPASGTYKGMLFFSDRSLATGSTPVRFQNNSTSSLTGTLYFPTLTVEYQNNAATPDQAPYLALIANKVLIQNNFRVRLDVDGSETGITGPTVVSLIR